MDNKQAIENLKLISRARLSTVTWQSSKEYDKIVADDIESLQMAIEALEKQTKEE